MLWRGGLTFREAIGGQIAHARRSVADRGEHRETAKR
jgi:hypothetical protein